MQRVRQQGQGTGLALDLPHQQIDQPRLQQQADLAGGALDRRPQVAFAHGAQQMKPGFDDLYEVRMDRQLAQTVGAQGDDQRTPLCVCGEGGEEHGLGVRVVAERDRLLALVDHQHRRRTRMRERGERVHGLGTRGDHDDPTAVALQRGRHTGSNQR